MRIGLIGINMYVRALNYACPLHIYAFQSFLRKHGFESEIIDYMPNTYAVDEVYDYRHPIVYHKGKIDKINGLLEKFYVDEEKNKHKIDDLKEKHIIHTKTIEKLKKIEKEREERYDKQQEFIDSYLVKTEKKYNCAIMELEDPGFDCYICITDIIWDKFSTGYEPGFFLGLSCMDNKWKIAYSASKLVTRNDKDKVQTAAWINDIDFVSVREDFMQKTVQEDVRPDVACVLDPVLLHGAAFYEDIMVEPEERDYVLLYYVVEPNPVIVQCALDYAKKHNLKVIELSEKISQNELTQQSDVDVTFKYGVGIQEWIGYFRHAKCVFTNSFHGCCLNIIFQKDFYASRRDNYDKIEALLRTVGLTERIADLESYEKIPEVINSWDSVRQKLTKRRRESEYFILNALTVASQQKHPKKDYLSEKKKQMINVFYNIGKGITTLEDHVIPEYVDDKSKLFKRAKSIEFSEGKIANDGTVCFHENVFKIEGYKFIGYKIRIHLDRYKFYCLEDGSYQESKSYSEKPRMACKLFKPGEHIPVFNVNRLTTCVAECVWEEE